MFHVKHFLLCDLARRRKDSLRVVLRETEPWKIAGAAGRNAGIIGKMGGGRVYQGQETFPGNMENIAVGSSFRAERRTVRARWCCWEKGLSGTGCGSIHLIASRGKMFHVEHCGIFMAPAQEDRIRRGPLLAAGRGSPFWRRRHSRRAMASGGPRHLFWRGR